MKKSSKTKEKTDKRERFVTLIDADIADWVRESAQKSERTESDFIRLTLKEAMQNV